MTLQASNYPTIRPTLDLQFAATRTLSSLITFTRSSSGTFFGSDSQLKTAGTDVPRFDHNPSTGESLGLLIEEQRTNRLLWNRDLTNAAWVATNITPLKNQTGIDGVTNSASSITASANSGTILQTITNASAARATSAYVKRITGTGTVEMTQDNGTTWTAVTVTNAWTRVTIPSATVTNPVVGFRLGTSGDALAIDYVQCEDGVFSTSAIATTTAAATRNADVASISGSNFSSWYRRDEGTFYGDAQTEFAATAFPVIVDGRTSSTDIVQVGYLTEALSAGYVRAENVDQAIMYNTGLSGVRRRRVACGMASNNFGVATNGGSIVSDLAGTMPTNIASIFLGSVGGSSSLNGTIRRITYWPARLSNNVLQELTR